MLSPWCSMGAEEDDVVPPAEEEEAGPPFLRFRFTTRFGVVVMPGEEGKKFNFLLWGFMLGLT